MRSSTKSILSLVLILTLTFTGSSCSLNEKSFDLLAASKKVGAKEVGVTGFKENMGYKNRDNPIYVNETGVDAQELFDTTINRFGNLPDVKITKATAMYYPLSDDDGNWHFVLAYSFSFETKRDAKAFYQYYQEEITDKYDDGGNERLESGTASKGYEYTIGGMKKDNGNSIVWSVYLYEDQAVLIYVSAEDKSEPKPIRKISASMGVISPYSIF